MDHPAAWMDSYLSCGPPGLAIASIMIHESSISSITWKAVIGKAGQHGPGHSLNLPRRKRGDWFNNCKAEIDLVNLLPKDCIVQPKQDIQPEAKAFSSAARRRCPFVGAWPLPFMGDHGIGEITATGKVYTRRNTQTKSHRAGSATAICSAPRSAAMAELRLGGIVAHHRSNQHVAIGGDLHGSPVRTSILPPGRVINSFHCKIFVLTGRCSQALTPSRRIVWRRGGFMRSHRRIRSTGRWCDS